MLRIDKLAGVGRQLLQPNRSHAIENNVTKRVHRLYCSKPTEKPKETEIKQPSSSYPGSDKFDKMFDRFVNIFYGCSVAITAYVLVFGEPKNKEE